MKKHVTMCWKEKRDSPSRGLDIFRILMLSQPHPMAQSASIYVNQFGDRVWSSGLTG